MTLALVKLNLAGGEVSPSVGYRSDLVRTQTAGLTMRNMYVSKTGAGVGRAGLVFGWEEKDSSKRARVVEFIFNAAQAYILEFGNLYMRIGVNGSQLVVPSALAWDTARVYFPGDITSFGGIGYVNILIADATVADPSVATTFWSVTSNVALPWDTLAVYAVGAIVYFSGFNYYCTAPADATIADPATATGYWYKQSNLPIAPSAQPWNTTATAAYAGGTQYAAWDLVTSGGLNWRSNVSTIGVAPGSNATWTPYNASIMEIPTPYTEDEVYGLTGKRIYKWQSNDVIRITHPLHPPFELTRLGLVNWTLKAGLFQPSIARPTAISVTGGSGAGFDFRYRVTAIKQDTLEESLPGYGTAQSGSVNEATTPVVVTIAAHGYVDGDEVVVTSVTSGTNPLDGALAARLLNKTFIVNQLTVNTFELLGSVGDAIAAAVNNITVALTYASIADNLIPTPAIPQTVSWTAVAGAVEYWIYRDTTDAGGSSASLYGFCGRSTTTSFEDGEPTPNLQQTPPTYKNPFDATGKYPAIVGLIQQRQVFASTVNEPAKVWMSQPDNYNNFTEHSPRIDSDVVIFAPATQQANETRHVLGLDEAVILTAGESFLALTDNNGAITQSFPNLKSQDAFGANDAVPVKLNGSLIYAAAIGQPVYEMAFDVGGRAPSRDMTAFAPALFIGRTVKEMAFSRTPDPILWCVLDSGRLLGCTFLKDQQIEGWHRHDTGTTGAFESVAVIPEGTRHVPYFSVKRTLPSATVKRFVEFFADRKAGDPAYSVAADARFFDSMKTYDGRNTGTTTLTLSAGPPWTFGSTLTLTATAVPNTKTFFLSDEGNRFQLTIGADSVIVEASSFVSGTELTVLVITPTGVPTALQAVATATWTRMVVNVRADHLPGVTCGLVADGEGITQRAVSSGVLNIPAHAGIIHYGIPLVSDFETLDQTVPGKEGSVTNISVDDVLVEASRFWSVGPDFNNLRDWQNPRKPYTEMSLYSKDQPLFTGSGTTHVMNTWSTSSRVCIRQSHGFPLTILGVIAHVAVGGHR